MSIKGPMAPALERMKMNGLDDAQKVADYVFVDQSGKILHSIGANRITKMPQVTDGPDGTSAVHRVPAVPDWASHYRAGKFS